MTRNPGTVLRHLRQALGLSPRQAAERLGMAFTDYARLELGRAHLESTEAWDDLCYRLRGAPRPTLAPRYDDVFFEGAAALEGL